MSELFNFYTLSIIIFSVTYSTLIIFIAFLIKRKEKIARPFLISLLLHFLIDLIGILLLYTYNISTKFGTRIDLSKPDFATYALLGTMALLLFMISPLYLIYNLEKLLFQKELIKERHIFTILQVVIIGALVFIAIFIPIPALSFLFYAMVSLLQIIFFLGVFLHLSIKSTENYKRNARIVFTGYLWQFLVNIYYGMVILIMSYSNPNFLTIVGLCVLFRLVGLTIMAYGLLKLYTF